MLFNNSPASASCLMKKSIRDFLRFPSSRPARTAVLPATITANSNHSTVNCSVCKKESVCFTLPRQRYRNVLTKHIKFTSIRVERGSLKSSKLSYINMIYFRTRTEVLQLFTVTYIFIMILHVISFTNKSNAQQIF